jgi:hypothetical protein
MVPGTAPSAAPEQSPHATAAANRKRMLKRAVTSRVATGRNPGPDAQRPEPQALAHAAESRAPKYLAEKRDLAGPLADRRFRARLLNATPEPPPPAAAALAPGAR